MPRHGGPEGQPVPEPQRGATEQPRGITYGGIAPRDIQGVQLRPGEMPRNSKMPREILSFIRRPEEDKKTDAIVDLAGHLANTGKMNIDVSQVTTPEQNGRGGFVTQIPVQEGEVYHVSTNPVPEGKGAKHNIVEDTQKK